MRFAVSQYSSAVKAFQRGIPRFDRRKDSIGEKIRSEKRFDRRRDSTGDNMNVWKTLVSQSSGAKTACAILLFCVATAMTCPAQTFTSLVSFNKTNGWAPYLGSLVQGTDGNLYGTTALAGNNNSGTVFRVTPDGVLTSIYSFCSQPRCADGVAPNAGLVLAMDGNFYGATPQGGQNSAGTVFRITAGGVLTTLYSFCSQPGCTDGNGSYAGLIQGTDGNFYGTSGAYGSNLGTVFKL